MDMMDVREIQQQWRPGSQDPPWTWWDEERDLLSQPCPSESARQHGIDATCPLGDRCYGAGCYQRALEDHLRDLGRVEQPVCLGPDGRVWDGHHRIVAARRLGFYTIPIEDDVDEIAQHYAAMPALTEGP